MTRRHRARPRRHVVDPPERARGPRQRRRSSSGWRSSALFVLLTFAEPILDATIWARQQNVYDPQFGFDSTVPTRARRAPATGSARARSGVTSSRCSCTAPGRPSSSRWRRALDLGRLPRCSARSPRTEGLGRRLRQPPQRRDGAAAGDDRGLRARHRPAERGVRRAPCRAQLRHPVRPRAGHRDGARGGA